MGTAAREFECLLKHSGSSGEVFGRFPPVPPQFIQVFLNCRRALTGRIILIVRVSLIPFSAAMVSGKYAFGLESPGLMICWLLALCGPIAPRDAFDHAWNPRVIP